MIKNVDEELLLNHDRAQVEAAWTQGTLAHGDVALVKGVFNTLVHET